MKHFGVACVGNGYFSQFHLDAWSRIDGVELVAAVDRNLEKARKTGLPAFENIKDMLESTKPDIVDLIIPPEGHHDSIMRCLEKGISTIICQKPFCVSEKEARSVVEAAEKNGANIVIHENFRFQPWYRRMKQAIEDGLIGEVQQLTFRLRTGDGQGESAYLERQPYFQKMERFLVHETAVHWLDTFCFLLGKPVALYADLRKINPVIAGEDAGYLLLDFENGARALFDGNRNLDHAATDNRTTLGEALLEGTRGAIELFGDGSLHLREFGSTNKSVILEPFQGKGFAGDCVFQLQKHVVDAIRSGAIFENSARDYLNILTLERAAYFSAEAGKKLKL